MQNTSHAVMAQRVEPHDSLDHFPTPPWATRALVEHVLAVNSQWSLGQLSYMAAWEPACAEGYMVRALSEYFGAVRASDIHDYGSGYEVADFLLPGTPLYRRNQWIITNPPFRLAAEFVKRGKELAEQGVAVLVRTVFLESVRRYHELFRPHPPLIFAPFVERVPMLKGRLDQKASSATSYAWFVWPGQQFTRTNTETRLVWIPPCRKQLERAEDYR